MTSTPPRLPLACQPANLPPPARQMAPCARSVRPLTNAAPKLDGPLLAGRSAVQAQLPQRLSDDELVALACGSERSRAAPLSLAHWVRMSVHGVHGAHVDRASREADRGRRTGWCGASIRAR